MAWTLCSKQDVQTISPLQLVELKDEWSEMVEGLIKQHLGQPYLGTSQVITDEYHSGDGSPILRVSKPPIISIESLQVEGATIQASDYVVFNSYVQLKYDVFTNGNLTVKISYTSGSTTVPQPVRLAATAMIVAIINYNRRFGADASVKWGQPEQKLGEDDPNKQMGLTSHLSTIMKRTLRRDVPRFA